MARVFAMMLVALLGLGLLASASQVEARPFWQPSCTGRLYRIQPGDSWQRIAQRTGASVEALKAANPLAVKQPKTALLAGHMLCIPTGTSGPEVAATPTAPPNGVLVTVRRGDSWAVLAARYGVNVFELQDANPQLKRAGEVLRVGDQVRIPASAVNTGKVACPASFEAAPAAAAQALTEFNGIADVLRVYLARCNLLNQDWGSVDAAALRSGPTPEVIAVVADLESGDTSPLGQLVILGAGDLGWEVLYESGLASDVALLDTGDLNADGQPDVAWTDTTCGAQACFTTAHVVSYTPDGWEYWVNGSTTMAAATARFADVLPEGSGQELVMTGDLVPAVEAGPQRAMTDTWASLAGAPYILAQRQYAPSDCLYHHILDANAVMAAGTAGKFAQAVAAYRLAVDDPRLVACWTRDDEPDELRAFALYRLAVAQAYSGNLDAAGRTLDELAQRYPSDSYANLAALWWIAYQATRDASASCAAVTAYANKHPDTWERLSDFGYANPTFSAKDVCPPAL